MFESLFLKSKKEKEQSIYESEVTSKYFENWNGLEFHGVGDIKKTVRKNIINSEKQNEFDYINLAEKHNISIAELKQELQKRVESVVEKSDFFLAVHASVLKKVLEGDGRFKTQFETNRSNGCLNPSRRSKLEHKLFDFPESISDNKEKRPVYGYFSDGPNGEMNNYGKIPPPNNVTFYGDINIKLKKANLLNCATIAFQDTLDYGQDHNPPTPAAKPHFTSIGITSYENSVLNLEKSSKTNWGHNYTEAQYHKQVTINDIESVHVSENNQIEKEDIDEIKKVISNYNITHPEAQIKIVEY